MKFSKKRARNLKRRAHQSTIQLHQAFALLSPPSPFGGRSLELAVTPIRRLLCRLFKKEAPPTFKERVEDRDKWLLNCDENIFKKIVRRKSLP